MITTVKIKGKNLKHWVGKINLISFQKFKGSNIVFEQLSFELLRLDCTFFKTRYVSKPILVDALIFEQLQFKQFLFMLDKGNFLLIFRLKAINKILPIQH
jgi:hypothetical protein